MQSNDDLFQAAKDMRTKARPWSLFHDPPPPLPDGTGGKDSWAVPGEGECFGLWDEYSMPEHIREHSRMVADIATCVAEHARDRGMDVDVASVRASGLLHDLAKHHTIRYGGHHAQLGGAWVQARTGNPLIAQGVLHHIWWPWEIDAVRYFLPLAVIYADKRVRHDSVVTVDKRFKDIAERYGKNKAILKRIEMSRVQALEIEQHINTLLGVDLNACSFGGGRLVERT